MSKLPDELVDCMELRELDISHNSFVNIPPVVFKLPKLKKLNISHNFIMGKYARGDQDLINQSIMGK